MKSCEVCGSDLKLVLDLGMHPLCDDLVELNSAEDCIYYPIRIFYCHNCRTAHNECQVSKEILFPKKYHYRSRFTGDVLNGLDDLLSEALSYTIEPIPKVLDIGCNDGSLLNIARDKYKCKTYGIEPTDAGLEAKDQGHSIVHGFFDKVAAVDFLEKNGYPDIITFTNVFAHISDLPALLNNVKILLGKHTQLVIENHYLLEVIKRNQFDTFYHEHPRTYSLNSFVHIANHLGLNIHKVSFPSRYGGNIRVLMSSNHEPDPLINKLLDHDLYCDEIDVMQSKVHTWVITKQSIIRKLVAQFGPLPAKAFPGRAAILYRLLALDSSMISACYEKPNSLKVGHYIPGTKIPIVSESLLKETLEDSNIPIINNAWHISEEIAKYMVNDLHIENPLINIVDSSDFS